MAEDSGTGSYLLGDSPAEIRHLAAQAEVYSDVTVELFDLIGVEPGSAAIDVGCGVMGVLDELCARIGEGGTVVGLDREPRLLEFGRQLAEERHLPVEFVEADATATGLSDGTFDFVHARSLLMNVQNPLEILAEMARIARPGGVLAVQEPDAASWTCDPPHPAWEILRGEIVSAYRRTGKDLNIGRRIGRMLRELGVESVQMRPTLRITHPGEYFHTFLLTIANLVREVIIGSGELTGDEFAVYAQSLSTHLREPGTITCQPIMWQAFGRMPTG
ncbi:MAG: methyltransferase domain-containing protein [Solirubrobacterales bacterium]|nr:methyltransferase domain-containing protein [Solirubrobacterales bacterium]